MALAVAVRTLSEEYRTVSSQLAARLNILGEIKDAVERLIPPALGGTAFELSQVPARLFSKSGRYSRGDTRT